MKNVICICGGGKSISHFSSRELWEDMASAEAVEKLNRIRHAFQGRRKFFMLETGFLLACLEKRPGISLFVPSGEEWKTFFSEAVQDALLVWPPMLAAGAKERKTIRRRLASLCRGAEKSLSWDFKPEPEKAREMVSFLSCAILLCSSASSRFGEAIDKLFAGSGNLECEKK